MNTVYHGIFREPAGAETAVLLLHGILSAPQYFAFLLPEIPPEYAVSGVLFDGHGAGPEALGNARLDRWREQAEQAFAALSAKYSRIIIAAHSMGTLFAAELAARHPEKICGMLLLGVPAHVHLTPFGAFGSLLCAAGYQPEHAPQLCAMRTAFSIAPDINPLHYTGWIARYLELLREIGDVRPLYRKLRVRCAVYQSARDEFVSLRSLAELKGNPNLHVHLLRHSSHFYYTPQESSRILRTWRSLLQSAKTCRSEAGTSNDHVKERLIMKFFKKTDSGEIIAVQENDSTDLTGAVEIIPNTVDAAKEKHVPVISREGQTVTVTVGSTLHPMLPNHYIEWIMLETENGVERKDLEPGEEPVAQFFADEDDKIIAAYESCNLHGIWKAEA